MHRQLTGLLLVISMTACSAVAVPTATPTPTATVTATHTPTHTPTVTLTPTNTGTPTPSPTATDTATVTPTPSDTPPPSSTPGTVVNFTLDNWEITDIPFFVESGFSQPYIAFLNLNDRDNQGSVLTPQPGTGLQTLYYSPPVNRAARIEILQLPESTGDRVYISPDGLGIAYFIEPGEGIQPGLYMADLETGVSGRVLPLDALVQRGFVTEPVWSADGERMAMMLATPYATDIFALSRRSLGEFINLTNSGAYDLFPAFSPDGRYLAFVSDRARCPTWRPEQPNTCDRTGTPPPDGGHLYVQDLETGAVTQLADVWITEGNAPRWINERQIVFGEGEPLFGDTTRTLWIANAVTGQAREVRPAGVQNPLMLNEAWSPDGTQVFYQSAGAQTELHLTTPDGDVLASVSDLNYPRYGVAASWSPSGEFIAVGGLNGQCPYGSTVLDTTLAFIARSNPPPSMCSPVYAPNGAYVAYTGISLNNFDGRADIYSANPNGFGSVNLTGDMRGTMTFLRWIRTPDEAG